MSQSPDTSADAMPVAAGAPASVRKPAGAARRKIAKTTPQKSVAKDAAHPTESALSSLAVAGATVIDQPKAVKKAVVSKGAAGKSAKPAKASVTAPRVLKQSKAASRPVEALKPPKVKLVRDSFTIPAGEYAVLAALKQRALVAAHPVKKSELLRAGIQLLAALNDKALLAALKGVPAIKTGRPKGKNSA